MGPCVLPEQPHENAHRRCGRRRGFLPVFSFEEEAQTFLALLEDDEKKKTKWSIRQTSPGELISVLLGPCGHARWVATRPAAVVNLRRPGNAPLDEGKARTLREVPDGGAQRAVRRGSSGLGATPPPHYSRVAQKGSSRKMGFRHNSFSETGHPVNNVLGNSMAS